MSKPHSLLVFNLKTNADDEVLGFTTVWLRELARHFGRVDVITMIAGRIDVPSNVYVRSVGKERGYSEPRRVFEFYRHLRSILRTVDVEACFAHMIPHFAILAWPLLRLRGIPIVLWYAHGNASWSLRAAIPLVDRVATSSRSGVSVETSKVRIVGQGIETDRFRPASLDGLPHEPFTVLSVGRLSPIKRYEVLLEAMRRLADRSPELRVRLRVVGNPLTPRDHVYADRLRSRTAGLGIQDRVLFDPGLPYSEIDGVYREADAFANSSDTDSVDKTCLEAMSSGIPIVTSNVAFREVLDPDLAAAWVVPKRDVEEWAQRIAELAQMGVTGRRALGLRLREIVVRNHGLDALVRRLATVIDEAREER